MTNLTDTAETRVANYLAGAPMENTDPVLPYRVALVTDLGGEDTAGTEVTGGGYRRQLVEFSQISSGGVITNHDLLRYENMPAITVVGVEIYDSAATPVRWFYGALTEQKQLTEGAPFEFPEQSIKIRAS